jgi:hypothetical protein
MSSGYLIAMDPKYLQGHGGEEDGRYYYEHILVEVTNNHNALVCGQRTTNECLEQDNGKPPPKLPFPIKKDPIQYVAPRRKRTRSGIVPRQTIRIATYAECYDLTKGDDGDDDDNDDGNKLPVPLGHAKSK